MQRFPQIEENTLNNSRPFRSIDYIHSNIEVPIIKSPSQTKKIPIPVGNGRARSCSGGRNKAPSPPVLSRKGFLNKIII
jgi:hypothetical protein